VVLGGVGGVGGGLGVVGWGVCGGGWGGGRSHGLYWFVVTLAGEMLKGKNGGGTFTKMICKIQHSEDHLA